MTSAKMAMIRAWEIARAAVKQFGHNAKSYIKMALVMAWDEIKSGAKEIIKPVSERIDELVSLGFNRWTKGNFDRLYINASLLGLVCHYYKSGNISSAWFNGDEISNSEAYRMRSAKTYIDIKTGNVYSDNRTLKAAAAKLARIEEQ